MSLVNEIMWLMIVLLLINEPLIQRFRINYGIVIPVVTFLFMQFELAGYLVAAFGFIELSLVLFATARLDNRQAPSINMAWHYFGLLAWLVVLTFLFGFAALYELGYSAWGVLFLLPLAVYAVWQRAFRLVLGLVILLLVWLASPFTDVINLFDATGGALFALVYLAWWVKQGVQRMVARKANA